MASLRKKETQEAYRKLMKQRDALEVPRIDIASEKKIREFEHWILIKNKFPYDRVAKKHDLLFPRRVFTEDKDISGAEREELREIKKELQSEYDIAFESFSHSKSIRGHFHIHFISFKDSFHNDD